MGYPFNGDNMDIRQVEVVYIHSDGQNGVSRLVAKAESENMKEREVTKMLKRFYYKHAHNPKELI